MSARKVPSATEKLVEIVNQKGLTAAAKQYDCDKSNLSRWLRTQGYTLRRVWVKAETLGMELQS